MGLFGRKKKDMVRGTARVVSSSRAPHAATHGNLVAQLVVEAPGIPPYSHEYRKLVTPVDRWPHPGTVLPVEVDPHDPRDVDVLWDEVPRGWDVARNEAEQMAAALRQQQAGQAGQAGHAGQAGPGVAGVPPEATGIVEQLQQMFPGAQVNVGGAPPPPPGAPVQVVASQSGGDPVERLGKLAQLREAGIIDDTQFEQLKAQILGQAGL